MKVSRNIKVFHSSLNFALFVMISNTDVTCTMSLLTLLTSWCVIMSLYAVFFENGIRVHIYKKIFCLRLPPHTHTLLITCRLSRLHQLLNIDMLNCVLNHQNVYFLSCMWLNVHYRKWYVNIRHLLLTTLTKLQI